MPELDTVTFRSVLSRFATGVTVVTTWDGERPWGTTVNSFNSVSLRPALVMVAFDHDRRIVPSLRRTGRYAVNILGEEQRVLSDCFSGGPGSGLATDSGPSPAEQAARAASSSGSSLGQGDEPRAALCGAEWNRGATGLPVLTEAIASLECTIVDIHPAGDHDLYVGRVDAASLTGGQPMPLLYYSGRYLRIERASIHDLEGKPER